MASVNRVVLVGNLTKDPDLRYTQNQTPVAELRVAINDRERGQDGQWYDRPSYITVTVWGKQAESCSTYLAKGDPVAIDGRLRHEEYTSKDGSKREAVKVVAQNIQFLKNRGGGGGHAPHAADTIPDSEFKVPDADFSSTGDFVPASAADDDIPFAFLDRWGQEPLSSMRGSDGTTSDLHLR